MFSKLSMFNGGIRVSWNVGWGRKKMKTYRIEKLEAVEVRFIIEVITDYMRAFKDCDPDSDFMKNLQKIWSKVTHPVLVETEVKYIE